MAESRSHRRKKRKRGHGVRSKKFKKEAKLFLIITVCCLVAAALLSLLTGKVPSMVDQVVQKQIGGAIQQQMKQFGGGAAPGGMDINKLKKQFGH